jgi:hypothetical protein
MLRDFYSFPASHLKFTIQPKSIGALAAYQMKKGDCTEYSSLFCALSRAAGIPARQYSVFGMGKDTERVWMQPNHTAAEVYISGTGWIPVDPNLGLGRFDNHHSFGKTSNNIIYLQHEGAWVRGMNTGQKAPDKKMIEVSSKWKAKVVASGKADELFAAYR